MSLDAQGPNRRSRRRARTADAILDAAERLFLTRGFEATTVEQLADEADVAVGSLYGHFGGKEGVYAALIDRSLELDARYCDEGWASGGDPVGRLLGIAEGYLGFAREHPGHFRLFRFPPAGGPNTGPAALAARRVAERVRAEVDRMAGALREAMSDGTIRPVEPERAAVFLWAAWDGVIAAHVLPGGMGLSEPEFDEVLALGRETLARGLLAPDQAAP
ncbi:MAG: TetR/AcrR family transcriptional regulator [Solirubrobacteraceae bacterium]